MKIYRDPLLKMFENPGGDCKWVGGRSNVYYTRKEYSLTTCYGSPDPRHVDIAITQNPWKLKDYLLNGFSAKTTIPGDYSFNGL